MNLIKIISLLIGITSIASEVVSESFPIPSSAYEVKLIRDSGASFLQILEKGIKKGKINPEHPEDRFVAENSKAVKVKGKPYFVAIWDVGAHSQRIMIIDPSNPTTPALLRYSLDETSFQIIDGRLELHYTKVSEAGTDRRVVELWPK